MPGATTFQTMALKPAMVPINTDTDTVLSASQISSENASILATKSGSPVNTVAQLDAAKTTAVSGSPTRVGATAVKPTSTPSPYEIDNQADLYDAKVTEPPPTEAELRALNIQCGGGFPGCSLCSKLNFLPNLNLADLLGINKLKEMMNKLLNSGAFDMLANLMKCLRIIANTDAGKLAQVGMMALQAGNLSVLATACQVVDIRNMPCGDMLELGLYHVSGTVDNATQMGMFADAAGIDLGDMVQVTPLAGSQQKAFNVNNVCRAYSGEPQSPATGMLVGQDNAQMCVAVNKAFGGG